MVVFIGEKDKTAIPDNRIYKIVCSGNKIEIWFDSGDITYLNESLVTKQITVVSTTFDTEDLAVENFRAYFKACETNKGAFYFG